MAILTIESEVTGDKISLIISPSDAFEILDKFQDKYPNALKPDMSIEEFKYRWTMKLLLGNEAGS